MNTAFLISIAFSICSSHGLKCYEYKLNSPRFTSSEPIVQDCDPYNYGYENYDYSIHQCATVTFKNYEDPDVNCGDEEFCTERGCISTSFCNELGTPHENNHPGRRNVNVPMTCCESDLCNIEAPDKDFISSAKTFNKTSSLFCIIIFIVVNFISW